jgi:hypothetical protein
MMGITEKQSFWKVKWTTYFSKIKLKDNEHMEGWKWKERGNNNVKKTKSLYIV